MGENIIVRKANKGDLDEILSLINSPQADNGNAMESRDGNTIYQSILEDSNYFQIVASSEQGLIGTLTLIIIVQMSHEGSSSALITDLITQDSPQKKEIAFELLKYATTLAEEYGCYKTIISGDYQKDIISQACRTLGFEQNSNCLLLMDK